MKSHSEVAPIQQAIFMARHGVCSMHTTCDACFITEQMCRLYRGDFGHLAKHLRACARTYLSKHQADIMQELL